MNINPPIVLIEVDSIHVVVNQLHVNEPLSNGPHI